MRDLEQEINKVIKSAVIVLIGICLTGVFAGLFQAKKSAAQNLAQTKYVHNVNESHSIAFSLLWQEFSKNMSADKIQFKNQNPPIVNMLNNSKTDKTNLNSDSCYIAYGIGTNDFVENLKSQVYERFSYEVQFAPVEQNDVILYVAMQKNFSFTNAYDELMPKPFNSGPNVKYFGINWLSENNLRDGTKVLFYNNENDFAIKLTSDFNETILYRNSSQKTPEALYKDILLKEKNYKGTKAFEKSDTLSVPYIEPPVSYIYRDIIQKQLDNLDKTNIAIARQDFKIKFDNCGLNAICPIKQQKDISDDSFDGYKRGRDFNFNKNFILFFKENGAKEPYYTLFVDTAGILVTAL